VPRNHPRFNVNIPAVRGAPPWTRAAEDTLLLKWLKTQGINFYRFAKLVELRPDRVAYLARGQVLPDLSIAFRIQNATKGGVPASSWLGTTLGRQVWNTNGVRASQYWRKRVTNAKKKAQRHHR